MSILIYNARPEYEFKRQTAGASGFDLCANIEEEMCDAGLWDIEPGKRLVIPTGIHLAMPQGVEAQVRGRSGLAAKNGVIAAPGTVDSDYRGEIKVTLFNLGSSGFVVTPGMRIAQLVFAPVVVPYMTDFDDDAPRGTGGYAFKRVAELSSLPRSERGDAGHGSTGMDGGK